MRLRKGAEAFLFLFILTIAQLASGPASRAETVTFDDYTVGTPITDQYESVGIRFSGEPEPPMISIPPSSYFGDVGPALGGATLGDPQYGSVSIVFSFLDPADYMPLEVTNFTFVYYVLLGSSVTFEFYSLDGTIISEQTVNYADPGFELHNPPQFHKLVITPASAFAWIDDLNFQLAAPPPRPDPEKEKGCRGENMRGNPCNAATGNKYAREVDYSEQKTGLEFVRSYNSSEVGNKGLGIGWISNLGVNLELGADTIVVRSSDGRGETWRNASGTWRGDPDSRVILTQDSGGYTVSHRDSTVQRYDLSGKLITQTDRSGKITSYGYDTDGRLSEVTGPFGHTLTFGYGQGVSFPQSQMLLVR